MKLSKKDQDLRANEEAGEAMANWLKKKSQHFALNTRVVQYGKGGGLITRISKDGGSKLWVEWDDGTAGPIRNPNYRWKGRP